MFALLVAPALGDDAQTAFDALKKEYDAAVQEFFRPAREAQARGEKVQLDPAKHPNATYVAKFAEFATCTLIFAGVVVAHRKHLLRKGILPVFQEQSSIAYQRLNLLP